MQPSVEAEGTSSSLESDGRTADEETAPDAWEAANGDASEVGSDTSLAIRPSSFAYRHVPARDEGLRFRRGAKDGHHCRGVQP